MSKYKSNSEVVIKADTEDTDNWIFYCQATKTCKEYTHKVVPKKELEFVVVKCKGCKKCFKNYFSYKGYPWNACN